MTDNHFEKQRQKRIKSIQKYLKDQTPLQYDKAVAEICLEWGVGRNTAKNYLRTLEDAERIQVPDDNQVEWSGDE